MLSAFYSICSEFWAYFPFFSFFSLSGLLLHLSIYPLKTCTYSYKHNTIQYYRSICLKFPYPSIGHSQSPSPRLSVDLRKHATGTGHGLSAFLLLSFLFFSYKEAQHRRGPSLFSLSRFFHQVERVGEAEGVLSGKNVLAGGGRTGLKGLRRKKGREREKDGEWCISDDIVYKGFGEFKKISCLGGRLADGCLPPL